MSSVWGDEIVKFCSSDMKTGECSHRVSPSLAVLHAAVKAPARLLELSAWLYLNWLVGPKVSYSRNFLF